MQHNSSSPTAGSCPSTSRDVTLGQGPEFVNQAPTPTPEAGVSCTKEQVSLLPEQQGRPVRVYADGGLADPVHRPLCLPGLSIPQPPQASSTCSILAMPVHWSKPRSCTLQACTPAAAAGDLNARLPCTQVPQHVPHCWLLQRRAHPQVQGQNRVHRGGPLRVPPALQVRHAAVH
jgi:hypothetical protein